MKEDQHKSGLEEAENKLFQRGFKETYAPTRPSFYSQDPSVVSEWRRTEVKKKKEEKTFTVFQKIFFASIVFFVLAAAAAFFLFFSGGNIVSNENVHIDVLGPIAVPGGEALSLQIAVTNNNSTPLEYTDLSITYPEGTRSADGLTALPRTRKSLNVIKAGETVQEIVRASLYGKEGAQQTVHIAVEYRVAGSNAIFVKEAEYTVSLSSAPLSVSVETLSEVNANQEIELAITVSSNSQSSVEDVLLKAQYPFGFDPTDAAPRPRYGTTVWELGTIKPGEVISIKVKGIVRGQDNEQRIFTFTAGRRDTNNEREIAALYSLATAEISVKRPFLSVDARINGSAESRVPARAGERTVIDMVWVNNLPVRVVDVAIEARLEGEGFDKQSVQVSNGAYRSVDNTIVWNSGTYGDFSSIDAGQSGTLSFALIPATAHFGTQVKNPSVRITISISGRRVNDVGAVENISSLVTSDIVVNSDIRFLGRGLYYSGPFQNTGPLPPRPDQKTLYTIVWTLTNSSNDITNTVVRGVLPPYVSWIGRTDPAQQNISFNEKTGEVLWRPGDIVAGAGFSREATEIAFQIALTPSLSDVGKELELVQGMRLSGTDRFTTVDIQKNIASITTNLSSDPTFSSSQAQVTK